MACDGELHDDEVTEINRMVEELPYFDGTDLNAEVPPLIDQLRGGVGGYDALFDELARAPLKPHQRLQTLEALLNVVGADGVLQPAEVTFVRSVKDALGVATTEFIVHFPQHVDVAVGAEAGSLTAFDADLEVKHFESGSDYGAH